MNLLLGNNGSVHGTSLFSIDDSGLDIPQIFTDTPEEWIFAGVSRLKWLASAQPDAQSTFGRELKISADVSSQCQNSAAMEVGVFPTGLLYSQGGARTGGRR